MTSRREDTPGGAAPAPRLTPLPSPRGPLSAALLAALSDAPGTAIGPVDPSPDPLLDDDLQLALYLCYELHYGALAGVDDRWEWEPTLIAFRASLEAQFEGAVRDLVPAAAPPELASVGDALQAIVAADVGPGLARFLETRASLDQALEFLVHRSAYQLKEADPHSWAIPRLVGAPKVALVEIQVDEYGGGRADRVHAAMFARTLGATGLSPEYGAYLDPLPAITLATVNLMSLFGLHRRLRGALVGHLAAFEMTSSLPNRRYGNGLRRLGFGADATAFFDEHVEADAVHENIAAWDLADRLSRDEPALAGDVLFGARALLELDRLWAEHVMVAWERGESSLRSARALAPAAIAH